MTGLRTTAASVFIVGFLLAVRGFAETEGGKGGGEEEVLILNKLIVGRPVTLKEASKLDGLVIRIDTTAPLGAGAPEVSRPGKKIYIFKVESESSWLGQFRRVQESLWESQLGIIAVLESVARHQEELDSRLARLENLRLELLLGLRDLGWSLGAVRCESAGIRSASATSLKMVRKCLACFKGKRK